eukprot:2132756-Ditylum_brightwellii.AAC.1
MNLSFAATTTSSDDDVTTNKRTRNKRNGKYFHPTKRRNDLSDIEEFDDENLDSYEMKDEIEDSDTEQDALNKLKPTFANPKLGPPSDLIPYPL